MSDEQAGKRGRQAAMEWVAKAYQAHMKHDLEQAIALYTQSIEIFPTAEAYTFRGWARSNQKDYAGAIQDCHEAIDLDPEFGNPYNDIGAYYLEQGELDEAIPWLHMALKAKRYENYCFPHVNLGRIFEAKGQLDRALEHYQRALAENPRHAPAARALERVRQKQAAANPESIG